MNTNTIDKFWKRVIKTDTCWNWSGSFKGGGYGQFYSSPCVSEFAHRFSYRSFVGPIPDGLCVLHHCDNVKCVRPDHLFLGTNKDNSEDMVRKDRQSRGERQWNHKLTIAQVRKIHCDYQRTDLSIRQIARKCKIGEMAAGRIIRGESWKHLKLNPIDTSQKPVQAGENNPSSKLTQRDVDYIRKNYRPRMGGILARKFGVSRVLIGKIVRKEIWPPKQ